MRGYIMGTMNGEDGHCRWRTMTCINSEVLSPGRSFGMKSILGEMSLDSVLREAKGLAQLSREFGHHISTVNVLDRPASST